MRILLTGSSGQLGNSIKLKKPDNFEVISLEKKDLDFTNFESSISFLKKVDPDWIINCAAYTNVDKAENSKEIAYFTNSEIPKTLSLFLKESKGKLIQISTDYVFSGNGNKPYEIHHKRSPINYYGFSKLQGELNIESILNKDKYFIIRTSWLMGSKGNNFLTKLLKLHSSEPELNIVYDQTGCYTCVDELSEFCWFILNNEKFLKSSSNKIHFTNSGISSWYDIAYEIGEIGLEIGLLNRKAMINPILSKDFKSSAERPNYSVLDTSLIRKELKIYPKYWRKSLYEEIEKIKLDL